MWLNLRISRLIMQPQMINWLMLLLVASLVESSNNNSSQLGTNRSQRGNTDDSSVPVKQMLRIHTNSSSNSDWDDQLAQEQRLALQIITTDVVEAPITRPSASSTTAAPNKQTLQKEATRAHENTLISFDDNSNDAWEQQQQQMKQKFVSKKIVINLDSLISSPSNGSESVNHKPPGGPGQQQQQQHTKLIIGYSPETSEPQSPVKPSVKADQTGTLSKAATDSNKSPQGGHKVKLAKANLVPPPPAQQQNSLASSGLSKLLDALHRQGGVPVAVMPGREQASNEMESGGRLARAPTGQVKLMLNSEALDMMRGGGGEGDVTRAVHPSETSHQREQRQDFGLHDAIESLSGEIDSLERHLEGGSSELAATQAAVANQQQQQLASQQDSRPLPAQASSEPPTQAQVAQPMSGEYYDIDGQQQHQVEQAKFRAMQEDEQASRDTRQQQQLEEAERLEADQGQAAMFGQRSNPTAGYESYPPPPPAPELVALSPEPKSDQNSVASAGWHLNSAATANVNSNSNSNSNSDPPSQSDAKLASNKLTSSSSSSSENEDGKSKLVDERVAKLLARLRLYTTKDQLMKVARDLQQNYGAELLPPKNMLGINELNDISLGSEFKAREFEAPRRSLKGVSFAKRHRALDGQQQEQEQPAGELHPWSSHLNFHELHQQQQQLRRNRVPAPINLELMESLLTLASNTLNQHASLVSLPKPQQAHQKFLVGSNDERVRDSSQLEQEKWERRRRLAVSMAKLLAEFRLSQTLLSPEAANEDDTGSGNNSQQVDAATSSSSSNQPEEQQRQAYELVSVASSGGGKTRAGDANNDATNGAQVRNNERLYAATSNNNRQGGQQELEQSLAQRDESGSRKSRRYLMAEQSNQGDTQQEPTTNEGADEGEQEEEPESAKSGSATTQEQHRNGLAEMRALESIIDELVRREKLGASGRN